MKRYIKSAGSPVRTYRNRRNENKFIETKKYDDGHSVARQYMEWDTPQGKVRNYSGSASNKGRWHRASQHSRDMMLEDYDEVLVDVPFDREELIAAEFQKLMEDYASEWDASDISTTELRDILEERVWHSAMYLLYKTGEYGDGVDAADAVDEVWPSLRDDTNKYFNANF